MIGCNRLRVHSVAFSTQNSNEHASPCPRNRMRFFLQIEGLEFSVFWTGVQFFFFFLAQLVIAENLTPRLRFKQN